MDSFCSFIIILCIIAGIIYAIGILLSEIMPIIFVVFCVVAITFLIYFIFEKIYFCSKPFLRIKESIKSYAEDCNELNNHIEDLKSWEISGSTTDYGVAQYIDNSKYSYRRSELNKNQNAKNIYNCSLCVCKNAQQQPFKYICKYFGIKPNEETLEKFECMLNHFAAAEQGKELLQKERDRIVASVSNKIPFVIRKFRPKKLMHKLGFKEIDLSQVYFPRYKFLYISAGGNSSMECNVIMDIDNINRFVLYLSDIVKFKKSAAGQRALMTSSLREKIKKRDNYTCQICGLSIFQEPNLLLEIDHIIPIAKHGLTVEDNLQTLCWRCNRKKGKK